MSFIGALLGLLEWLLTPENTNIVKVPKNADPRMVPFDTRPLSSKRGWQKNGRTFAGYYRTKHGAWAGEITIRGDKFDVFISDAPIEQLQRHSRWKCFYKKRNGKHLDYGIHLSLNPKDGQVDAIIFYVEKILIESFEMAK